MRLIKGLTAIALLTVLSGAAARAQEDDNEEPMARRISVDFKKTPFEKCLGILREKTGVNMLATQKTIKAMEGKPVSFTLKDTPIWSTVHLFARSCGLEVSHEHGVFMFSRQVKPDEVWATIWMKIDDGKIEITILRADVPVELRRNLVRRLLVEEFLEEREDEGEEEGGEGEDENGDKAEKKPKPRKKPPAKGELF